MSFVLFYIQVVLKKINQQSFWYYYKYNVIAKLLTYCHHLFLSCLKIKEGRKKNTFYIYIYISAYQFLNCIRCIVSLRKAAECISCYVRQKITRMKIIARKMCGIMKRLHLRSSSNSYQNPVFFFCFRQTKNNNNNHVMVGIFNTVKWRWWWWW